MVSSPQGRRKPAFPLIKIKFVKKQCLYGQYYGSFLMETTAQAWNKRMIDLLLSTNETCEGARQQGEKALTPKQIEQILADCRAFFARVKPSIRKLHEPPLRAVASSRHPRSTCYGGRAAAPVKSYASSPTCPFPSPTIWANAPSGCPK